MSSDLDFLLPFEFKIGTNGFYYCTEKVYNFGSSLPFVFALGARVEQMTDRRMGNMHEAYMIQ